MLPRMLERVTDRVTIERYHPCPEKKTAEPCDDAVRERTRPGHQRL